MEQYMETALTTGVLITFQKLIHPPMTISTTYTQLNKQYRHRHVGAAVCLGLPAGKTHGHFDRAMLRRELEESAVHE